MNIGSGLSQINLADQQAVFVWPTYCNSRIVHIKRLDTSETESRFQFENADSGREEDTPYRIDPKTGLTHRESAVKGRAVNDLA